MASLGRTAFLLLCTSVVFNEATYDVSKWFEETPDKRLTGSVTNVLHVRSDHICKLKCSQDISCLSYNIVIQNNGQMKCELNSNAIDSILEDDAQSSYFGKF